MTYEIQFTFEQCSVRDTDALHSSKLVYNFWLPQNLTNSLLLTRRLTDNINS